MPRLIVKCKYFRNQKHGSNHLNYIATREGVDTLDDAWMAKKATAVQKELIESVIVKYADAKSLDEYYSYLSDGTRGSATEFITRVVEEHTELIENEKTYLDYIATRPRSERLGEHGLFTDDGKTVVLSEEAEKIKQHDGNIWTLIISLNREDAERLGFNSAERWRDFLRSQKQKISEQSKIPMDKLVWYGAFHNEKHHPHVHFVFYSLDKKLGYVTKQSIDNIRSSMATDIFAEDLHNIYDTQTARRNTLTDEARKEISDLIFQLQQGTCTNAKIAEKLTLLAEKLKDVSGKKVYGYLPPALKNLVDEITDDLAEDERIKRLYDLWYEYRYDVLKNYTDHLPTKVPLSRQKEFKQIRNAVIKEALKFQKIMDSTMLFEEQVLTGKTDFIHQNNKNQNKDNTNDLYRQLVASVSRLIASIGKMFKKRFEKESSPAQSVDSRLKREVEEKKNAQQISC